MSASRNKHEWTCPNCNTRAVFTLPEAQPPKFTKNIIKPSTPLFQFVKQHPLLSLSLIGSSIIAIGSGVFLYIEGQSLWAKAKTQPATQVEKIAAVSATINNAKPLEVINLSDNMRDQIKQASSSAVPFSPGLRIKPKKGFANFRGGPGMDFPIVGMTKAGLSYPVVDWKDRWLKIQTENKTAWVRSDMIIPSH